ncbi:MAG: PorV/PorQ family protein [Ignavibacteriales bacterium]|nr:PorV/PorQ family protein [Ignavibacteriales bacterium]
MNKNSKLTTLLVLIFILGCASFTFAQKVGTTSFQFLKVMPTARATAMGDAYVTLATGSDGVFWNPAGLSCGSLQEVTTTLTFWLFDTKQLAWAYALPMGDWGSIGLQLQYVSFGEIEETRVDQLGRFGSGSSLYYNPGLTGRTFSPKSYLVGLSYARNLTSKFSTGITVKYVAEDLWNDAEVKVRIPGEIPGTFTEETYKTNGRVMLFDFGMLYNTGYHTVQIAAAVQNFGSQVKFAKKQFPAPLTFRLGTSADLVGKNALFYPEDKHRITLAFDMFQPNDYLQQMHLGTEYNYDGIFSLRSGYKFNYDSDGLTFGAGVSKELGSVLFLFDYSYGDMGSYLTKVHRISLGAKF